MSVVTIRRGGNILELSEGGRPLSKEVASIVHGELTYVYRDLERGWSKSNFRGRERVLYSLDRHGRTLCLLGYLDRLRSLLERAGHEVEYRDATRPHGDPDRYVQDWDRVYERFRFRPGQEEYLRTLTAHDRGLGVAPPGFGKSVLHAAMALLYPKARIHIVVDSLAIQTRLVRGLRPYLPQIGSVSGRRHDWSRVTVISADSLRHADPNDPHSFRGADIVIGDEAHRLAAPTHSRELARYRFVKMWGSTATAKGRSDGRDLVIEGLFGPVRYHMTYPEAVRGGLVVPIEVRWLNITGRNPSLDCNPGSTVKEKLGIWSNSIRNAQIANAVASIPEDAQVLVYTTTIEHAVNLRQFLPDYHLAYGHLSKSRRKSYLDKGLLHPDRDPIMTEEVLRSMQVDFERGRLRRVICTDVWGTGVDFRNLTHLVRADASSSEILATQVPGRASRVNDGKQVGVIIDCWDQFDRTFLERSRKRSGFYARHGWVQLKPWERKR